jgi:UDP-glucose 4-epimerase
MLAPHWPRLAGLDRAPDPRAPWPTHKADIRHIREMQDFASERRGDPMIHMAADAEVLAPWSQIPETFGTNLMGTWNLLTLFEPKLFVFPSTGAVYGNSSMRRALPRPSSVKPLSLYGASKSTGEILLRDWTIATGSNAVVLRLGNIIGAGCRGLIPFLVHHALRYPEGEVRAELRGHGKMLRDYTPVEFVASIFRASLTYPWKPGALDLFNIGTGFAMTNRDVTRVVQRVLRRRGLRLECNFNNRVPHSEANEIVLNVESLIRKFDVRPPTREAVEASIEASVYSHLV